MTEFSEEIFQSYIEDSREQLDGIADDLLGIEAAGADVDPELVNKVFRAIHSTKGGAGFLELEAITELTHSMESVLNMLRNDGLVLTGERTSALLSGIDLLGEMLDDPGSSNEKDLSPQLETLQRTINGEDGQETSPVETAGYEPEVISPLRDVGSEQFREPPPDELAPPADGLEAEETAAAIDEIVLGELDEQVTAPEPVLRAGRGGGVEARSGTVVALQTGVAGAAQALETLDFIYLVEYPGSSDSQAIRAELEDTGVVLEHRQQEGSLFILFATAADPEIISTLLEVEDAQIRELTPKDLIGAESGALQELESQLDQPDERETPPGPALLDDGAEELPPEAQMAAGGPTEAEGLLPEADEEPGFAEDVPEMPLARRSERAVPIEPTKSIEPARPPEPTVPTGPVEVAPTSMPKGPGTTPPPKAPAPESSLRVHVGLLDRLMNLAGELVLTRNQLIQEVAGRDMQAVETSTQRLDQVTTELQEMVVSTRMQPVGNVFGKFRRIVRDLARDLGKDVELIIEGEEVELDKTIVEALADPLTHLVRNSLDHGVETPATRRQVGKSVPATLRLRALHEAGQVLIEVIDDGKGIDPRKIREKCLSSGQFDRAQLDVMDDKDLVRLIFQPGFSTSEEVTGISGRGVGMDVVHTNLTRLGGVVDINTQPGAGTTISIKLPLTLAIIPSLLVTMGDARFAIPQVNLAELVRVPAAQVTQRLQQIGAARVLRLRGRLLPLIGLREVLDVTGDRAAAWDGAVHIAVLKAGDFQYGLIVDELLDSREIVVKSLDQYLSDCKIYAGATILGDGAVALILDVAGISGMLELENVGSLEEEQEEEEQLSSDAQELLLVRIAPEEQFALPVSLVRRIERTHRSQIETAGGRVSMQYRGRHLVLFSVEQAARVGPRPDSEYLYVIVFSVSGSEVGLLVSQVVDIVVGTADIEEKGFKQPGISGSTIVNGETTLLLDLYDLVRAVDPDWVAQQEEQLTGDATILVAEDTPFFQKQFARLLDQAGYRVLVAADGAEALELLEERHADIDLVVTDIEMPRLDGLGLTREIRADERFAGLPVIAVTSLSGEEDERRGREAGVDEYLVKLDKEQLLRSVHRYLE